MNQFSIIKMYSVFTQQQDAKSSQFLIDYIPGDTGAYPGTQKISLSKCIEIMESVFLSLWNYVINQQAIHINTNYIIKYQQRRRAIKPILYYSSECIMVHKF